MSPCFHQWHLEAPRVPLFCSYHAYCDGICERSHISITNPRLFWPIPSVLVSQTEWNSQGHDRSGVAKKRVRFGSGGEKKTLITQHDPHLPGFFTLQLLSRCWIWSCVLVIERPEQPMLILSHYMLLLIAYSLSQGSNSSLRQRQNKQHKLPKE